MQNNDLGPDPLEANSNVLAVMIANVIHPSGMMIPYLFDKGEKLSQEESEPPEVEFDPHEMVRAAGVQFRATGKIYEFDAKDLEFDARAVVIAETENGQALGEVVRKPRPVPRGALPNKIFPIVRLATRHDFRQREKNREIEDEIFLFTAQQITGRRLEMLLVDVDVYHSGKKAIIFFTAEHRVDFRDLVKDLVQRFRMRVELRQIGPRDAAKNSGGIGDCGRELCCSSWLREFAPVSIRMAKDQGLALNPNKISGQCGKLKCCLAYEDEIYRELGQGFPKIGKRVSCSSGIVNVISKNLLKQEITVILDDGEQLVLKKGDWTVWKGPLPQERSEGPSTSTSEASGADQAELKVDDTEISIPDEGDDDSN